MARVFGITESLKSLKSELNNNGIYKFNSVKEIKDFLSNYKLEKLSILKSESDKLDEEYSKTSSNLKQLIISRDKIINSETNRIDNKISDVNKKIDIIKSRDVNFIIKLFLKIKLYSLNNQLNKLISSKNSSIDSLVKGVNKNSQVWMSHGDHIEKTPKGFIITSVSKNNIIASMENKSKKIFGLQFHPEVYHTLKGELILSNFLKKICKVKKKF